VAAEQLQAHLFASILWAKDWHPEGASMAQPLQSQCAAEDGADGSASWVQPSICTANELMTKPPQLLAPSLESGGSCWAAPSPGAGVGFRGPL
jgi:hypothetical protein